METKVIILMAAVLVYFIVRYFLEKQRRVEVESDLAVMKDKGVLIEVNKQLGGDLPEHPIPPHMLDHVTSFPTYIGNTDAKDAIAREEDADTTCELESGEAGPESEGGLRDSKGRIQ